MKHWCLLGGLFPNFILITHARKIEKIATTYVRKAIGQSTGGQISTSSKCSALENVVHTWRLRSPRGTGRRLGRTAIKTALRNLSV